MDEALRLTSIPSRLVFDEQPENISGPETILFTEWLSTEIQILLLLKEQMKSYIDKTFTLLDFDLNLEYNLIEIQDKKKPLSGPKWVRDVRKMYACRDEKILYYMKIPRHVYLAILRFAYFSTLKFRGFAKILYFESF